MPEIDIIKASLEDIKPLVDMGRDFFNEAGWQDIYGKWSNLEAADALIALLEDENSIMFMAKEGHKSIGMIGAYVSPFWLKKSVSMITEYYWYVMPEYRSHVGVMLKNALDEEAIKRGVQVCAMGSLENLPSLDKFYERNGYSLREKTFMKRLK